MSFYSKHYIALGRWWRSANFEKGQNQWRSQRQNSRHNDVRYYHNDLIFFLNNVQRFIDNLPLFRVKLSCDRRIVDEAIAAQLLQTFRHYLEEPDFLVL